jgi:hypothetical protein
MQASNLCWPSIRYPSADVTQRERTVAENHRVVIADNLIGSASFKHDLSHRRGHLYLFLHLLKGGA